MVLVQWRKNNDLTCQSKNNKININSSGSITLLESERVGFCHDIAYVQGSSSGAKQHPERRTLRLAA